MQVVLYGRLRDDQRRAGDSVAEEHIAIRRPLPVPGAWAYGRRGGVVIVVADESYTDDELARLVALAKLKLSFDNCDGERPTHQ